GEEPEPAPVDREVEAVDAELLAIAIDHAHYLGAGEQVIVGAGRGARRHVDAWSDVVDLILDVGAGTGALQRDVDLFLLIRDERRHPELVGDADPAAGRLQLLLLVVVEVLV